MPTFIMSTRDWGRMGLMPSPISSTDRICATEALLAQTPIPLQQEGIARRSASAPGTRWAMTHRKHLHASHRSQGLSGDTALLAQK